MKVELAFTNRLNQRVSMTVERDGESSLDLLETTINDFLKLCGFNGYDKDCVFLHSLTQEEYDALWDFLQDMRANDKGE